MLLNRIRSQTFPHQIRQMSRDLFPKTTMSFDWQPTPGLLTGRTAIVTGSNVGLGFDAAIHLGKMGPQKLILAVRDLAKGEAAKEKIVAESGLDAARAEVWQLDLASFESVKAFSEKATSTLDRLDILAENAGIAGDEWNVTPDGWEATLQVNGLSTGLLGVSLLPLLARTASLPLSEGMTPLKPHLTIVGSGVHGWYEYVSVPSSTTLLKDFNDPDGLNAKARYPLSKLISLHLSRQIGQLKMAEQAGVVVNCVCPGLCTSELSRSMPQEFRDNIRKNGKPTSEGSKNIVLACTDDSLNKTYVSLMKPQTTSEFSNSPEGLELERRLWAEMSELWIGLNPNLASVLA